MYSIVDNLFSEWLEYEMSKRGWSQSDLAHAAGVPRGSIGNLLRNTRKPGPELCNAIALALEIPPEEVFRKAGLLSPKPESDEKSDEIGYLFKQLTPREQEELIELARFKIEQRKRKK